MEIHGYRPQSEINVDLVNENKMMEEHVLRIIDELHRSRDVDPRWLAIGRTHIEQGFMAINRAIFKPERVKLPAD